jgi:hypothetical protein
LAFRELESFSIRKYKKGRNVFYDVWLSPSSEKSRAIEELIVFILMSIGQSMSNDSALQSLEKRVEKLEGMKK